jgi:hypothetical protein
VAGPQAQAVSAANRTRVRIFTQISVPRKGGPLGRLGLPPAQAKKMFLPAF